MNFIVPASEELSYLRSDPLIWEQELDVRPEVAASIEAATGMRAGRVYWRSAHDHLYALELADLGRGRPSMATVYGFWDRYEPRPPEHEIDADLLSVCLWVAEVGEGLNPADVAKVAQFAKIPVSWPEGSVLRTPEERFANLPGFPYEPKYVEVEGLRVAYVEQGAGDPILMLHGEPTWGYLYRHMIPPLAEAGRVIVPDLIGFGRSDKPVKPHVYSYKAHVRWMREFLKALHLERITLVCQDWGGLIGLRVLSQMPERFARLVAMNTGISDGRMRGEAFLNWRRFSQRVEMLDLPKLMANTLRKRSLTTEEAAAYQAPFPSREYQTGALVFPRLVPIRRDAPGAYDNRVAIERLRTLDLPVLLPWGVEDPITAPAEARLRSIFRNSAPPLPIAGAGHFVQEDAGEEIAQHIVRWLRESQ
ncbi:MAG TPA: haloalkane dehalogenase [Bryobacteraceae bacterium]|nr:haloalkane dehalogenase [Bryobacteraceae bacterium]